MSPYVLAAAGVLIIIVFLCVVKNRRSGKSLPPSPPSSLPLIGHLHLIGPITHRSLHELYLRYGSGGGSSGLLLLQLGRRRTLVVSTAAAAADLFRNHDLAFASRPRSVAADRLMYGCRNVSFAPYGEDWRRGKKAAVVHLLSPRRVASFAPVRAAEAAALVARARRAAEAREAVELRELLYSYTNAVVTRAATGAAGATVERLKQLIGSTAPLVAGLQPEDVLPDAPARFVRWATGLDKMLDDRAEAWDRFLSEILAAHQEKGAGSAGEEEDEDFLDVLLRLRREGADGLEFTDDRIKAMVKVIFAEMVLKFPKKCLVILFS